MNDLINKLKQPPLMENDDPTLQSYVGNLKNPEELQQILKNRLDNTDKAMDIATRGPLADTTPEESKFSEDQLGPFMKNFAGGGPSVGAIQEVNEAKAAFPQLQRMFQVGDKTFPANSTAEAIKVHQALEQAGQVGNNRTLINLGYKK